MWTIVGAVLVIALIMAALPRLALFCCLVVVSSLEKVLSSESPLETWNVVTAQH
jgi:hypothetical protein